jgi:DNA invertase Pin-like site-specific DNA recombinase
MNLLERQKEGILLAKLGKKYTGRKKIEKPADWDSVYLLYKNREITGAEAMRRLNLKKNTFYNFVKQSI